jgi:hypothetical protein
MGDSDINTETKMPEARNSGRGGLQSPRTVLRKLLRLVYFRVYTISPAEGAVYITSGEPDPGFISYFHPGATITPVKRIFVWSIRKYIRNNHTVIIDLHPSLMQFFTEGIFTVPWIVQRLLLDTPFEELFADRERKRERKKALAFEFVVSHDPADLQHFYESMYLPFLRKRHENPTILELDYLRRHFLEKDGDILFIKKDDRIIAGGLCHLIDGTYSLATLGMLDEAYEIDGVNAALYYYGIMMAYKRGATYVDFGLSRPFLSDGVVMYKRKWGGTIGRDEKNNQVVYLKNLVRNGLIVLEDGSLRAVVKGDEVFYTRSYPDKGIERAVRQSEP